MTASTPAIVFRPSDGHTIPDCFIADRGSGAPILVAIHGISRNAAEIAARFAADPRFDAFTICAPLFERRRFGQYQQLIARNGRIPSDLALLDLLAALENGSADKPKRVALFGFSGGAQMAHRFAMVHPERVSAVCAVSAGWYLMPDRSVHYPYGLADDVRFDPVSEAILTIPMTIAVGTLDNRVDNGLRQDKTVNKMQGRTRITRARRWVVAMRKTAAEKGVRSATRFATLPKGVHDFGQCVREAGLMDVAADALCHHAIRV